MCTIDNKGLDKYFKFKNYIYDETLEFLENLCELSKINLNNDINEEDMTKIKNCLKEIKKFVLKNEKKEKKMFGFEDNTEKIYDIADIKLKSYIYFERYCKMIEVFLNEYRDRKEEEKKKIIDYYLFDNRLMELSTVGISFYYDCKYEKSNATLFRSENGKCTWNNQFCQDETFVDALKYVFNCCREHINKGNDKLILRSYSKCLGIDLFKYVSIPKHNNKVKLCIYENANINTIVYNTHNFSLQEFIQKHDRIEGSIDFCIDISTPRDGDRKNLKVWMDKFLGEDSTNIQSFTSPVSDKEVIMSYKPLSIKYPCDNNSFCLQNNGEWEFELNKEELICLLYKYYSLYYEKKQRNPYFNSTLKSYMYKNFKDEDTRFYNCIIGCLENTNEETKKKIEKILSFVKWEYEYINTEKAVDSIYKVDYTDDDITKFKEVLQNCI